MGRMARQGHTHAGTKKMMEDPRMNPSTPSNPPMPFDGKRMIFGGFEQVVEVRA